jgi:hypothetical protein
MWFKLGLEADDHPNMHLPPGLTVVDVVRDYLSALYQHAMDTLYRKFHRGVSCLSGGWAVGEALLTLSPNMTRCHEHDDD